MYGIGYRRVVHGKYTRIDLIKKKRINGVCLRQAPKSCQNTGSREKQREKCFALLIKTFNVTTEAFL
jgi:hypothetical protein